MSHSSMSSDVQEVASANSDAEEQALDMYSGSQTPQPPPTPNRPTEKEEVRTPMDTGDTDGIPVEEFLDALESLQRQICN